MPTTTNSSSSSSTLRFNGLMKPPKPDPIDPNQIRDPLELDESDVVWSFSISSDSYPRPTSRSSTFQSPPPQHRQLFSPANFGLSAALSDDPHRLVSRKSTPRAITPATRQEDVAANFHRSAPVNIPVWPKNYGERYSKRFDEVEDDGEVDGGEEEEMVPPHVIVARSHVTFSVFEGAGRTLKGRDLRRLRNTVFQKTGFID